MNLSIRRAVPNDAPDIAHVHVVSWQETYRGIVPQTYLDSLDTGARTELWKTRLGRADSNVLVAILDGQLCGFIGGGRARQAIEDFDAEFYAIYLLDAAKGKGIGRLLMRRLAETLLADGLTKAMLWVLADNNSRLFYEHLGGQVIAQKTVPVGGADLLEIAYGWQDLRTI
jgi:ribosomal protein S18 acetylase RimI-like enzyme